MDILPIDIFSYYYYDLVDMPHGLNYQSSTFYITLFLVMEREEIWRIQC